MTTRSPKDSPFCWQSKEALQLLHDSFSETNNLPAAYAVYLALSLIASDEKSETFTVRKALVAFKAGVSIRTASDVLKRFEELRIIAIERRASNGKTPDAASTYTLLKMASGVSNGCTPVGNGCTPVGNGRLLSSIADRVEESEKKNTERRGKEDVGAKAPSAAAATTPTLSNGAEMNQPEFPDLLAKLAGLPEFSKAWEEFGVMRRKIRKPLTPFAATLLLRKLVPRPQDVVAGLEMAIENSWQGFEWEWFDNRRSTSSRADNRSRTPNNGCRGSADPAPSEVVAWLETVIAAEPIYANKREEWRTWDHLPRHAQERFRAFQRDQKALQTVLV